MGETVSKLDLVPPSEPPPHVIVDYPAYPEFFGCLPALMWFQDPGQLGGVES